MKITIYCIVVFVFCSQLVFAESSKSIQFNAVEKSQDLDECDIKSISIQSSKNNRYYIAIKFTQSGMNKANNFFRMNKGKKLLLTFEDDVLINEITIEHPLTVGSLLIETVGKSRSDRIINSIRKIINNCSSNSI